MKNRDRDEKLTTLFHSFCGQAWFVDPHRKTMPCTSGFAKKRNQGPQRPLTTRTRSLPSNNTSVNNCLGRGHFHFSGNASRMQVTLKTSIAKDKCVEKFNSHGKGEDEDEVMAFRIRLHPIQSADALCVGFFSGATQFTDCDNLGPKVEQALNEHLDTTPETHIPAHLHHMTVSDKERKMVREGPKNGVFTKAAHAFVPSFTGSSSSVGMLVHAMDDGTALHHAAGS